MRERGYVTVMDLLQEHYGNRISVLLNLPTLVGSVLWLGAVFASLGSLISYHH